MKRIFLYDLEVIETQTIILPVSAIIISIKERANCLVLYALIDDEEKETKSHTIRIVRTGHPFMDSDECTYLGTVSQYTFVWHIFEKNGG